MVGGQTLQVAPGSPIQVGADGQVSQNGTALGQIELTDFKDSSVLTKAAGAYFANPGPQSGPSPASNVSVQQGALETSNFAPTEAAARMVALLRNFEMLERAAKIGNEMNQQAIEQVARVGS
jgi:flagellar basal body rod protein FlgG